MCKDLEDIFLSLPEYEIVDILGGNLPDYNYIEDISISVLGEVIDFLVKFNYNPAVITFPDVLNFDNKIKFNKLSSLYGNILKTAFYQDYIINEYFNYNSKFVKEELKIVFSNFYQDAMNEISSEIPEKADMVFDYILNKSRPRNDKAIADAVLILMAHYFESCDIYEEPKKPTQRTLFE